MSGLRSGLLAAWGTAFLAGRTGFDQVVATVTGGDLPHRVVGLPGAPGEVPLGWALTAWRDLGTAALRAVLPVPGDPRGLPGPGPFATAAMAAGEAVHAVGGAYLPDTGGAYLPDTGGAYLPDTGGTHLPDTGGAYLPDTGGAYLPDTGGTHLLDAGGAHLLDAGGAHLLDAGLGLVPEVTRHGSAVGSAVHSVRWRAYPEAGEPAPDPLSVAEAEHDLTAALREAASALAALDAASWRPELVDELSRARRVGPPALPPGYPPRAVRLLAQADRLAAVLGIASADGSRGALTAGAAAARASALLPVWTAVRRARLAAYNAA
jgi:hypothetical protein